MCSPFGEHKIPFAVGVDNLFCEPIFIQNAVYCLVFCGWFDYVAHNNVINKLKEKGVQLDKQ